MGVVKTVMRICRYLRAKSESDSSFEHIPEITKKDWTDAQEWIRTGLLEYALTPRTTNAIVLADASRTEIRTKLRSRPEDEVRKEARTVLETYAEVAEHGSAAGPLQKKSLELDDALAIVSSAHILERITPGQQDAGHPIMYQCSCHQFWHFCKCKHALGWAIHKGEVSVPSNYDTTQFESFRSGRPSRARGGDALTKNDGTQAATKKATKKKRKAKPKKRGK